jgi:hypothetical protein
MATDPADYAEILGKNRVIGAMTDRLDRADEARHNAENAEWRAKQEVGDVETKLQKARRKMEDMVVEHQAKVASVISQKDFIIATKNQALAEKDALILEWMHTNEAFKKLARQYGKDLGKTDDQRQQDFDSTIVSVAVGDATYANTEKLARAKERIAKRKP